MSLRNAVWSTLIVFLGFLGALQGLAIELPSGTTVQVRLRSKVSSESSKPDDPVEAVVIAPMMAADQFAVPVGAIVRGSVKVAAQPGKADERARLTLAFGKLEFGGQNLKIVAQVGGVDNARETVDPQGQIQGILASETLTARLDSGIKKVAERYAGFADILESAKSAILKPADTAITYDSGVEMELKLLSPLVLPKLGGAGPAQDVQPFPDQEAVVEFARQQPFQTMAERPSKPSDVTNLMLIGSQDEVEQAFTAAGWSSAAALGPQAKLETFRALAEQRGYKEAPVSVLLLEGRPPDLVFEKLNNTFAARHHLRVWRRPVNFLDKPVWTIAATHDIGIDFSTESRTFIHKIDSSIDRERAKVVLDLIFAGKVQSIALIDRPQVPKHGQNATGDSLETDGAIAVMLLK